MVFIDKIIEIKTIVVSNSLQNYWSLCYLIESHLFGKLNRSSLWTVYYYKHQSWRDSVWRTSRPQIRCNSSGRRSSSRAFGAPFGAVWSVDSTGRDWRRTHCWSNTRRLITRDRNQLEPVVTLFATFQVYKPGIANLIFPEGVFCLRGWYFGFSAEGGNIPLKNPKVWF